MNNENLPERITMNPKVMAGKPVIKGTRLTVEYIQGLLANGTTIEEILEEYPGLAEEDIEAACQTYSNSQKRRSKTGKRPCSSWIWIGSRKKESLWSFRGSLWPSAGA